MYHKKSEISSLQFALTNAVMKIFDTKSVETAKACEKMFNIPDILDIIEKRTKKFLTYLRGVKTAFYSALC